LRAGSKPGIVHAAGHFRVGVLHIWRRRSVHRAADSLVLRYHLAQAIERTLDLVHDAPAGDGAVARDEVNIALAVVAVLDPPDAAIHASSEQAGKQAEKLRPVVVHRCLMVWKPISENPSRNRSLSRIRVTHDAKVSV
jgi:hypothetical protein